MQQSSDQWRGASVDLLGQVWGPPSATMPMSGGGSVLSYERDTLKSTTTTTREPVPGNSSSYSTPMREKTENSLTSQHCTVLFFVAQDGKTIERSEARGAPAACAEIMKPRPDGYGKAQDGYQKEGNTASWTENGVKVSQDQTTQVLPPRNPPSAPLEGKWKFVRQECWHGVATQFGKLAMDGAAQNLESYTLDFATLRADTKSGSCVQHANLTVQPKEGRFSVHFSGSTAEGCSPLPEFDRVMEMDESGSLIDYNFGNAQMEAQFCAKGRWVQVFERL